MTIRANGTINRVASSATRTMTRRYMTALARAMPDGSAPLASPEPKRCASDCVTAVELYSPPMTAVAMVP